MADTLSRSDYDILLLHIVRDPKVFTEFCIRAKGDAFDKVLYAPHNFISKSLMELHGEYQKYPALATIRLKFYESLENSSMDPDVKTSVFKTFEEIASVSETDLCPSIAMEILQKVLDKQIATHAREECLKVLEQGASVSSVMNSISIEMARNRLGFSEDTLISKPLKNIGQFMIKGEHFATGVDFFDVLLGGGPWRHDLLGILAPSSGGKTTLAIQLLTSWIRQGNLRNAIYCTYEQPLEGDIMARICSCVTGISTKAFRGKLYDELEPELQAKLGRMKSAIEERLHVVDLSKGKAGFKGIDDIRTILRECNIPKEGPPTLLIIDWFLPCIQRAMVGAGVDSMEGEKLRLFGSQFMDQLKIIKNTENVIMIITHQLNPTAGTSGSAKKPDWGDAAEWKAFAWFMDICFAIGTLTEENVAWFIASKTRTVAHASRLVRLHGEYCKFVDGDNEYMLGASGKIVPKTKTMEDFDPTAKGQKKPLVRSTLNASSHFD
jgi:RecA/RadA recombinase